MDDAGMMQAGQSFKGLADVVNGPVGWNDAGWQLDPAGFSHHGPQIVAVIVHGIEIPAVSLVKVPCFQKMRVPQSCHGDGFGNKQRFDPVHAQNIHQKRIRGKKLQRGDFADNRKPDFKDLAHAAPAQEPQDFIFSDGFHYRSDCAIIDVFQQSSTSPSKAIFLVNKG